MLLCVEQGKWCQSLDFLDSIWERNIPIVGVANRQLRSYVHFKEGKCSAFCALAKYRFCLEACKEEVYLQANGGLGLLV